MEERVSEREAKKVAATRVGWVWVVMAGKKVAMVLVEAVREAEERA